MKRPSLWKKLLLAALICAAPPAAASEGSAPGFELQDLSGQTITLSAFRGKSPVLLVFWTTWCPYCARQIANINQMEEAFGPDELAVLAVNGGEDRARVLAHVKRSDIRYRVLLDPEAKAGEAYGVTGYPYMVLIDMDGNIAATDYGVTTRLVDRIRVLTDAARAEANRAGAV